MPKYSRGVLRLLGVLMVVALLAPMPSLIEGAKPDDNFGSVECKRCKDSCKETKDACILLAEENCADACNGDEQCEFECLDEALNICARSNQTCKKLCKPLCQGLSISEP